MTLRNLVGRSLDEVAPSRDQVQRLLASVARAIGDAKVCEVSSEGRFSGAYGAIRTLADIGLLAHGYRVLTSAPGHHATAIQTLELTFGIDARIVNRLDYLRKLRNAAEYSGAEIPDSAVSECLKQAENLHAAAVEWLKLNRRDLV